MLDEGPPQRRTWAGRLVRPGESGRSGSVSPGLVALGAAAFLASVVLDWQIISLNRAPTEAETPRGRHPRNGSAALGRYYRLQFWYEPRSKSSSGTDWPADGPKS